MGDMQELKETLSMLKKAVLTERENRVPIKAELESLRERVGELESEISGKEAQIFQLTQDTSILQSEKNREMTRESETIFAKPSGKSSATAKSMINIEMQNQKLQEDIEEMNQKNKEIESQIRKIQLQHADNNEQLLKEEEKLNQEINELHFQISDTKDSTDTLHEQYKSICKNNFSLSERNEQLKEETENTRKALQVATDKINQLKEFLANKKEYEELLVSRIREHMENNDKLANELLEYKNKLLQVRSVFQKFDAKKITPMFNSDVSIIIRQENEGNFTLEIAEKTKKKAYNLKMVENIVPNPKKRNRFILKLAGEKPKEFESEQYEEISTLIKDLVFDRPE